LPSRNKMVLSLLEPPSLSRCPPRERASGSIGRKFPARRLFWGHSPVGSRPICLSRVAKSQ
jgi:hypothetical protein